jgi:hypothetical protein
MTTVFMVSKRSADVATRELRRCGGVNLTRGIPKIDLVINERFGDRRRAYQVRDFSERLKVK